MNDMSMGGLGHNNPPPATLNEELEGRYKPQLDQATEMIAAAESAPDSVNDEATSSKFADLIKKMRFMEKTLDSAKETEREPFSSKVSLINAFFKRPVDRLADLRKTLNSRNELYTQRVAAEKARKLREEEERKRAEAAAKLQLAQDAEERKNEADKALSNYEALANQARLDRASANDEITTAGADLAMARADHAKIVAQMRAKAAEFANLAKDGTPASLAEKNSARAEFDRQIAAAKEKVFDAEEALRAARQKADEAKRAQRAAEEQAKDAERIRKAAERDEEQSLAEATRHEKQADKLAEKATGSPGELGRSYSEHGAISTLTRRWKSSVVDRSKLDVRALWPFIHGDAIEAALYKWMMAQPQDKRVMAGAYMAEEEEGQVR